MDKYLTKAAQLRKHFDIYGYGNFDISLKELAELLRILDSENVGKELKRFYERLEHERMD